MTKALHTQLTQQCAKHNESFSTSPDKLEKGQWNGRSVSPSNKVWTEINHLLKLDESHKMSDIQLLQRVCTICNVDSREQETLENLCTASPNAGFTKLTKIIVNKANLEQETDTISPNVFFQKLDHWVSEGDSKEKRTEAAEKIRTAYKKKTSDLFLNKLNLKTLPTVLNQLPKLTTLSCTNNQLTTLPDTLSQLPKLKDLRLGNNKFATLPSMFNKLTQLEDVNLKSNQLKTLPDVFKGLTHLENIYLDDNPLESFPKALYKIDQPLAISIDNTPLLNGILTPSLKLKIQQNEWQIREHAKKIEPTNTTPIFDCLRGAFYTDMKNSENFDFQPNDYLKTKQIDHDVKLNDLVKTSLSKPYTKKKQPPVTNHENLKTRLASCKFNKMRFLPCGTDNLPVHIFGSAVPELPSKENSNYKLKKTQCLHNLAFIHGEVDTMIAIPTRDEKNNTSDFVTTCAGNATHQPTKVLSMPIIDFCVPRFEHYHTLAKEMNTPSLSKKPKGIYICCNAGEGRTGTLLAATQIMDRFKKLDSESRRKLTDGKKDYTPDIFDGTFSYLNNDFKTTSFVGKTVQDLRQLEKETTDKQVGMAVESPAQFETLEILQCLLAASEKLNDTPPISDEQILTTFYQHNFCEDTLEDFFQCDYRQPDNEKHSILEAVKQLHAIFTKKDN